MSGVAACEIGAAGRRPEVGEILTTASRAACAAEESARDARFPISRWYLLPVARRLVEALARTSLRPTHITWCGAAIAAATIVGVVLAPQFSAWAAGGVWLVWCCDRMDGLLARRQGTASTWGAWLDANIDELVDMGFHAAAAAVAAAQVAASWPWLLFGAFVAGKYLWLFGVMMTETNQRSVAGPAVTPASNGARRIIELCGDADVRVHLLVAAWLGGFVVWELALTAAMFNARWLARYAAQARRLREEPR